jgi:potassium/hydrogen antiporter
MGLPLGKKLLNCIFPRTSSIAVINRDGKFITPSGSTVIEANDVLIVIADNQQSISQVYECLGISEPA